MSTPWVYGVAALAAAATLYGAFRLFGQRASGAAEGAEEGGLEIVSRTPVGLGGSLVVVRFEGRRILLGVTRGQWTALADLGSAPSRPGEALSVIDAVLHRALEADRLRRGRRGH
jgi:flagellar biogenesis protein FliO